MAELCGLLQDLGERIAFKNVAASSSSTPSSSSQSQPDLDPLETRFRSVLPTLLRSYVSPSSPGKEREIIAILKLLTHTARNYPGVFYNGKPSHTLPIIGRILPFFAEPAFRYISVVAASAVLLDYLKSVASFYAEKTSFTASSTVSVKCFSESFSAISGATDLFCDIPPSCKPADGPGILVNVTDEPRWQPFASCVIKIITRCLIDGTLHVEGLIGSSFMFNACSLICYGDAALQMALFDFARIATTILDAEIVPSEELILSILSILSPAEATWSKFRNLQYDSCVGACLLSLYSGCPTEVAICNAYMCVVNVCPPHIWKPECLITLLCSPKPCLLLVDCIVKAIDVLGIIGIEGEALDDGTSISGDSTCKELHISSTGNKRMVQIAESLKRKRRKMHVEANATGHNVNKEPPTSLVVVENFLQNSLPFRCKLDEELYADHFQHLLVDFVELLTPGVTMSEFTSPQTALTALSMLSNVFCNYPVTNLSIRLFQQVHAWIPFIAEQAAKENLIKFDLSLYLEAVDNILILQSCMRKQNPKGSNDGRGAGRHLALENLFNNMDMSSILVLPWTHSFSDGQVHFIQRTKCLSVQILYKIGNKMGADDILKILDMALGDESEDVRIEAIVSVPLMLFFSGPKTYSISTVVTYFLLTARSLAQDKCEQVKEMVVRCIGYLSCLLGCFEHVHGIKSDCKLYMEVGKMKCVNTAEVIMKGFWCPICDKEAKKPKEESSKTTLLFHAAREKSVLVFDFNGLHGLVLKFLLDGSSEVVQVACVEVLSRILMHVSEDWLVSTSSQWIYAIERLLLHNKRTVRQSFCSSIHWFLDGRLSNSLFVDGAACGKTSEQMFLDKIKHAFLATEDPLIIETILQCTSRILSAVDIHGQLFFFSLVLLIDQLDNQHIAVRVTASRLIKKSCHVQFKGGIVAFFSKFTDIRDGVFEYLCTRLVTRPTMIKEFAESVLGIELVDLIQRMVPIVLPRLVISQQDNNEVVNILHELANQLNTELPLLLLEWCHKVLAYVLLQADGKELVSALQFYEMQSGSGTGEIFAAVLPALLDELVRFLGDTDSVESSRRMARVPQMVQEVARIVTGSDDLPGFLRNHFVGLLNSIDRKMLRVEDFMLQKQALKCIGKLIEMIGTHLGTYVPKIIVLLMHAVEKESLQNESLEVWHFFITQLSKVSPSSLKHVASQVFAALIPCLERYKENPSLHLDKVVNIFEELVVENKILLAHNIRELPLLPSIPMLAKVNKVIEEARGSMSLRDHLRHAVDGLNHESLNVRYMVACELSKFLSAKGKDVIDLILGESSADLDILSSLITSLLKGCAEESRTHVGQRLKLVSADCLGAVGAVDPAKFKTASCPRFKIECSDDDLIFELIHEHLTRVFRAASDTIVQDSAALAIQELLKLAGCQASLDGSDLSSTSQHSKGREFQENSVKGTSIDNHEINERGKRLWARFSNYVKEIIAPCLTSKFQLQSVTESVVAGPIYRPSMSLRRWIYSWIRKLMLQANGSRANIFSACRGIVRHDMETAFYLLPYLVLNALCHGTAEACQGITEEILSVLNAAASESSGAAVHGTAGGQREVCIQAIFTLLDNLGQWVDDLKQEITVSQSTRQLPKTTSHQMTEPAPNIGQLNIQFNNVSELLVAIPKVTLAKASIRCQAYARSLLYFESHVREKSGSFNPAAETSGPFADDDISFLMEIYSGLDEPDGLFGLANLRKSSGLYDQLLINEKIGNWAEALTCCEQALQTEPNSAPRHSGVLNCLLNMCHLQAMITYVDGLISRLHQHKKTWFMQGVQAAWRLGRWDLMDEYLAGADKEGAICSGPVSNASFDMGIAKILQAMMRKDQYLVCERIAQSKQALLAPLAAAGMESYTRAYPFIVKLHMLRELEDFHNLLNGDSFLERSFSLDFPQFLKLVKEWEDRLHYTQPSLWAREPLLALRRMVYSVSNLGAEVGICWLRYAKLCRSAGHYETASRAILEAQSSGAPNVHIEKSKLFWSTRKTDRAIAELQQALLNMPIEILGAAASSSIANFSLLPPNLPSISSTQPSKESEDAAKTILLYTRWIHYTGQKQKEDVISLYSRVRELQPKWEKGYFFMAKYCDDLLVDAKKRQEENQEALKDGHSGSRIIVSSSGGGILHSKTDEKPWWSYLPDVLLFYAKGLHRGHKHLFQALPRLLTLWFEFGSNYHREGLSSNKEVKNVHGRVMSIMRGCLKDLPTYQWLTALSQLVSRICHQNEEVVRLVKHIITTVLQEYPQQALWIMAGVSKSTISARREAAAEILRSARKGSRHGSNQDKLFIEFACLIDHLIKLCFHGGHPKARMINIGSDFGTLKRMMPVGVIMPVQQALTVNLPVHGLSRSELYGRDLFSADLATISGIADEAEILSSLQKPKKVIFRGSDGADYPFLCKPKDDLRKDARMMEFTAMINHLLSKYPESRRRKLYIRTFAVVPLTEDCGMVEWVPHTRGLRHILQDLYVACGKFDRQRTNPMIKKIYDQFRGKMPGDEMLKTKILPLFPPIFHKWFLVTFSEPGAWFRARIAYAHTAAVWSMVGHIVGLGDRHGENILFDSTTGDCVHVDFSCLFDKGLLLEKPELVPFRLTQNMVDGLGITGYEGIFLKTCEITLSVLRSHRETLMSVLETFIHDPLVEWTKSHKSSGVEVDNPHAQKAMSNIEGRLQGVVVGVGAAPSLPLAVEGQAQRLIAEAVSHKNLGEMYIWWMPWF
ncbi:Serine/threonine-protein kinase [Nymphaea thermarum]|nr:Serine/threonine-protein kinase [Nymphaea thermarum]